MNVHTYRYGEAAPLPGVSVGVTRHPPRGIKRSDYARRGIGQVWLPMLGPSPALLAAYRDATISFPTFARRYRAEMRRPEARQVIQLLAATAQHTPVNLGCYCEDSSHCHRTLLAELVRAVASEPVQSALPEPRPTFASPACAMPEIED